MFIFPPLQRDAEVKDFMVFGALLSRASSAFILTTPSLVAVPYLAHDTRERTAAMTSHNVMLALACRVGGSAIPTGFALIVVTGGIP